MMSSQPHIDHDILFFGDFCPYSHIHNEGLIIHEDLATNLSHAKIIAINLECPLTDAIEPIKKSGPHLKGIKQSVGLLTKFGFNVANLANNHMRDYGKLGIIDTMNALDESDISYVGIHRTDRVPYVLKEVDGMKTAFISFTENEFSTIPTEGVYCQPLDTAVQFKQIQEAKKYSDYVIVQYHGGVEMYDYPTPNQQRYARLMIDFGASAVICHHSHCVSGFEMYQDKPIYYGLGNFFFPEDTNEEKWFYGYGVGIQFSPEISYRIIPTRYDMKRNTILSDTQAQEYVDKQLSRINPIIFDEQLLLQEWDRFCNTMADSVLKSLFRPAKIQRVLGKLGIGKNFLRNKVTLSLYNSLRCESHREKIITIIENIKGI